MAVKGGIRKASPGAVIAGPSAAKSPESITTAVGLNVDVSCKSRQACGYGFQACGLCPHPGMTAE